MNTAKTKNLYGEREREARLEVVVLSGGKGGGTIKLKKQKVVGMVHKIRGGFD